MKCPGQDMKYWKADAIFETTCPKCTATVEFYKDDTSRKCGNCGHRLVNPHMDFGCASYCQYAEQCLGTLPEDFSGIREQLLKDKVAVEVKRALGNDFRRIRRVSATARFAESIGKAEGGRLPIILCAAYLQGLGATEARSILSKVGAGRAMIEEVVQVIVESEGSIDLHRQETTILKDALSLQRLEEQRRETSEEEPVPVVNLHTATAAALASSLP